MSEDFFEGRKIDLQSLYRLEGAMAQFQNLLLEYWFDRREQLTSEHSKVNEELEHMLDTLERCYLNEHKDEQKAAFNGLLETLLTIEPRRQLARRLYRWLEEVARQRQEAIILHLPKWRESFDVLRGGIADDLARLNVVRLRDHTIPATDLLDIRRLFHPGAFQRLLFEARQDFKKAGECFLLEQYQAAIMLACRATEKVAKEYYHRLTQRDDDSEQTLGTIPNQLEEPGASELRLEIISDLRRVTPIRNQFMHADSRIGSLTSENAKQLLNEMIDLCSKIIEDLRQCHLNLSVTVRDPADFDQVVSAWIAGRQGEGVGRWTVFPDGASEGSFDFRDVQFRIGGVAEDFGQVPAQMGECISRRLARYLGVEPEYDEFIELADKKRRNTIVVRSETPAESLEGIWEIGFEELSRKPKDFLKWACRLLDLIADNKLRPNDPCLLRRFPDGSKPKYNVYMQKASARTKVCCYDRARILIIQTTISLSSEQYEGEYEYVAEINPKAGIWKIDAVPGSHKPDLSPIYRELKDVYECTGGFNYIHGKRGGKVPSVSELEQIINSTEKERGKLK